MNDKNKSDLVKCGHCAERINKAALRCKHCYYYVVPSVAPHEGTCPFCRETIRPEARVCMHCKSGVVSLVDGSIFHSAQARRGFGGATIPSNEVFADKKDDDKDDDKKDAGVICVSLPVVGCSEKPDPIAGYQITKCVIIQVPLCFKAKT